MERAKLFRNGGSQAVRLPRAFRFEGTEVQIRREGERVILEPMGWTPAEVDWALVRQEMEKLGPANAEFAAMVEEEMRRLQEIQDSERG